MTGEQAILLTSERNLQERFEIFCKIPTSTNNHLLINAMGDYQSAFISLAAADRREQPGEGKKGLGK